jgi:hypothetical protein
MFDEKSIALCLATKKMNGITIHQDLFTTVGLDAMSCPTVTRILRETFSAHEQ